MPNFLPLRRKAISTKVLPNFCCNGRSYIYNNRKWRNSVPTSFWLNWIRDTYRIAGIGDCPFFLYFWYPPISVDKITNFSLLSFVIITIIVYWFTEICVLHTHICYTDTLMLMAIGASMEVINIASVITCVSLVSPMFTR